MKIQNILFPEIGICTEEKMFFRKEKNYDREVKLEENNRCLRFAAYGYCSFDTYFNALSIAKWKKYTSIGDVRLQLYLQGSFEVILTNIECVEKKVYIKEIGSYNINSKEKQLFIFPYNLYEYKGLLAFSLRAKSDALCFGGWYDADMADTSLWNVDIAIDICTFRREAFIQRNIDILKKSVIEKSDSPLYKHLHVYISDNGKTLPKQEIENEYIHIVENKNAGGASGFTRGLIEIMNNYKNYPATHALLMDDDIVILPEALFRTYTILRCRKPEYGELFIGGAMLRLDNQALQVESGASWNAGELISNRKNLNLLKLKNCCLNEEEEYTEYNAWWYCCIPMTIVNSENLPLPIFIRGDDVEYGLRNIKQLALMNGICVWHEAFENKYSSFLQYYILRNLLYDNALHFPEYTARKFLRRLYKSVARELVYYRYKNIDLIFRGVNDFFKGVEFLKTTDGEALHKEIMEAGYKAVPVSQLKGAAYHATIYDASINQSENFLHKLLRYGTMNGYFLPAKYQKNSKIKIVSMAQCRPVNFYREQKVLNYDTVSGKGFITQKSWKETWRALWKLIVMTGKVLFQFNRAKSSFKLHVSEITNEKFWNDYLQIVH